MWIAREYRRQKLTMSTADVDNSCERREVIGVGNGLVAAQAQGHHGALKQGRLFWVFRQPVKPWASKHFVEGWFPSADGMQELLKGKISLAVDHTNVVAGTRPVGPQHGANLCQLEMTGQHFPEDPFRREKSHYTIKRVSIRLSGSR